MGEIVFKFLFLFSIWLFCLSSTTGNNVIVDIVVLNCQKCNQCLICQVSGHKSLGCSLNVMFIVIVYFGQVMSPHHSHQMSHKGAKDEVKQAKKSGPDGPLAQYF